MHLSKQIESMYDDAVRIRQDLHRIPEIGFQLRDTQAYVLRELSLSLATLVDGMAGCRDTRWSTPAISATACIPIQI